jgi:hypothetical protein
VALGAAALVPFAKASERQLLCTMLGLSLVAHMGFAYVERWKRHSTDNARQAAAFLDVVRLSGIPAYRMGLWMLLVVPVFLLIPLAPLAPLGALLTFLSLYLYEWAFVRAAQLPPLS